jgi:HEAT repeat protein
LALLFRAVWLLGRVALADGGSVDAGLASEPPSLEEILGRLAQADGDAKVPIIREIAARGPGGQPATPALTALLRHDNEYVTNAAALALATLDPEDPTVAQSIGALLKSQGRDSWKITGALLALRQMSLAVTLPLLPTMAAQLRADYHWTREEAAVSVGTYGAQARPYVKDLERAILHPLDNAEYQNNRYYFHVCIEAAEALRAIDPDEARRFLPTVHNRCEGRLER